MVAQDESFTEQAEVLDKREHEPLLEVKKNVNSDDASPVWGMLAKNASNVIEDGPNREELAMLRQHNKWDLLNPAKIEWKADGDII